MRRKEAIKRRQVAVFSLAPRLFLFTIGFCVLQSFFRPSRGIYFNVMGRRRWMRAKTTFGSARGITRIKKGNRALQRREKEMLRNFASVGRGRRSMIGGLLGGSERIREISTLLRRTGTKANCASDVLRFSAASHTHTANFVFRLSSPSSPSAAVINHCFSGMREGGREGEREREGDRGSERKQSAEFLLPILPRPL